MAGRDIRPICQPREAQGPSRLLLRWNTDLLTYLHWEWVREGEADRGIERACSEHYVCVMVCGLHRLWHTDVKRGRFCLSTNLQCIAVWPVIPECEFLKLGVADQEGKRRQSVSVCYRVGLRGLAKRLCLAWIPRAVEIPLQPQPPPPN